VAFAKPYKANPLAILNKKENSNYHQNINKNQPLQSIFFDKMATDQTANWSESNKNLSMNIRKNWRDAAPTRTEFLNRVNGATGQTYTLNFQGLAPEVVDQGNEKKYEGRLGDVLGWYLEPFADL
jgi:hypothetical protein